MMSPITITVEPVAPPAGRVTERVHPHGAGGVGIVGSRELGHPHAPDLIEPVVGFRNWRILRTGPARGELSSPYFPVTWSEPVMRAECRRWRTPEALLDTPHAAPQPECGCGICAYHAPTGEFSKVDYRAVSGVVTVWGRIEIGADEMRAELARVEALAMYSRWSRRQRDAVQEVAANLGVELVDLRELGAAAASYGAPPPASLLADPPPKGIRDRFVALFTSRVGD
jgi:hypothetical protein